MCTLTWQYRDGGYELLFNRDEQRQRAPALPPRYDATLAALYPIDPEGGGTWIALGAEGDSFCLLNYYQADQQGPAPSAPISRGGIIPELLARGTDSVHQALRTLPLSRYRPFVLAHLSPDFAASGEVRSYTWDGQELSIAAAEPPLVSSAVMIDQVRRNRRAVYRDACQSGDDLLSLHRSHWPEAGPTSVCMHRDDACTLSLSHIRVSPSQLAFDYYPGSPCCTVPQHYTIDRRAQLRSDSDTPQRRRFPENA